jgi:hypothetical protein
LLCSNHTLLRATGQRATSGDRWIGLGTALCLAVLITASGPHLVHHLADLYAGHSHTDAHKSQSTDCLVLSFMQHTPVCGDFFTPPLTCLPAAEQASGEPELHIINIHRPTYQARAPPVTSRS